MPPLKRLRYPELLFPKVWASGGIRMNSKIVSAKGEHTRLSNRGQQLRRGKVVVEA